MSFETEYRTFHLESEAGPGYRPENKFAKAAFGGDRRTPGRDARTPVSQNYPDVGFFRGVLWAVVFSAPVWIVVAILIFKK
jgi:hypothetical protein